MDMDCVIAIMRAREQPIAKKEEMQKASLTCSTLCLSNLRLLFFVLVSAFCLLPSPPREASLVHLILSSLIGMSSRDSHHACGVCYLSRKRCTYCVRYAGLFEKKLPTSRRRVKNKKPLLMSTLFFDRLRTIQLHFPLISVLSGCQATSATRLPDTSRSHGVRIALSIAVARSQVYDSCRRSC